MNLNDMMKDDDVDSNDSFYKIMKQKEENSKVEEDEDGVEKDNQQEVTQNPKEKGGDKNFQAVFSKEKYMFQEVFSNAANNDN